MIRKLDMSKDKTGGVAAWASDLSTRLTALRIVISTALLSGIALSFKLWFPTARSFPRAPLLGSLPQFIVPAVDYFLSSLLVVALVALISRKWPTASLIAAIILLVFLVLLDQHRLQPWVYQYLLLLTVLVWHVWLSRAARSTLLVLSILQLIVAMLYVWSGVQKLNYSFSSEVLPQLLGPLQNYWPFTLIPLSLLGLGIALIEIIVGGGLLTRRFRTPCIWLALIMHAGILGLLIWQGKNSVVWAWNAALMLITIILFWRSDNSVQSFARWQANKGSARVAQILVVVLIVMPILSFWGWWDQYLSGALYSGNTPVAVIGVDQETYEQLPEPAKRTVFKTKGGEQMLPLFEWSMTELNVPPYPELRVYKQVTREICKLAKDKNLVQLIVKERPAILDGSYNVIRLKCSQLED
jgi:hypothetical protein